MNCRTSHKKKMLLENPVKMNLIECTFSKELLDFPMSRFPEAMCQHHVICHVTQTDQTRFFAIWRHGLAGIFANNCKRAIQLCMNHFILIILITVQRLHGIWEILETKLEAHSATSQQYGLRLIQLSETWKLFKTSLLEKQLMEISRLKKLINVLGSI